MIHILFSSQSYVHRELSSRAGVSYLQFPVGLRKELCAWGMCRQLYCWVYFVRAVRTDRFQLAYPPPTDRHHTQHTQRYTETHTHLKLHYTVHLCIVPILSWYIHRPLPGKWISLLPLASGCTWCCPRCLWFRSQNHVKLRDSIRCARLDVGGDPVSPC